MSALLEERVENWALWYHYNKNLVPALDLKKRCDFMQKAVDGCLELLAIACKDIQSLEGREPSKNLWLPKGMKMNGNIKEFG